jgi:hypothetical protein
LNRAGTLVLGLALGAFTIFVGLVLLIAIGFFVGGIYELFSKKQYLEAVFLVIGWLVFAGLEFALARKTFRVLKSWRQQA